MDTLKTLSALTAGLALIVIPPLAAGNDTDATEATASPLKVCIDTARIRNHDLLSDDDLFIEESGSKYYLITMRSSCFGMRNARVIAFKDTSRRICSDDNFTEVVFRDAGRPMSCRISNIEPVTDKQAAEALVAEREEANEAEEE